MNFREVLNRRHGCTVKRDMAQTAPAEMCRLAVYGPERRIEVAVPAGVLVADLLPVLLHHLGENLPDAGLAHGGWVLQRMGGPPLDEESSVAALGLRDGDAVHLRPRSDQIPPVDFDDVADGVATGTRDRSGAWRSEMIRWAALGLFGAVNVLGVLALTLPGPVPARTLAASVIAVLDLAGAFALARAVGDRPFGLVAAVMAVANAGLAGLLVPDVTAAVPHPGLGAAHLFAAAVAVTVTAVVGGAATGWAGPFFTWLVTVGVGTACGAALATFISLGAVQAAATVAVSATVGVVVVPLVAFRLARIVMTPLPTQPDHLQEDIDPVPAERLLLRTATADRYMTGMHAGLGLNVSGALLLVAPDNGWDSTTLVLLVALVCVLMLRPLTSAWHRLSLAVPAVTGAGALLLGMLAGAGMPARLTGVALLLSAGIGLVAVARILPDRRITPYWGRIGDIVQLVATVALLPVLLAVLDVYSALRALGG